MTLICLKPNQSIIPRKYERVIQIKLTINFELPALNEYISAMNSSRYAGNKMKQETQEAIGWCIKSQNIQLIKKPVRIRFLWVSKNRKKDLDNVAFAKKFILDALVQGGVLNNDNRKNVCGFIDNFAVDKEKPRVEVEIVEA